MEIEKCFHFLSNESTVTFLRSLLPKSSYLTLYCHWPHPNRDYRFVFFNVHYISGSQPTVDFERVVEFFKKIEKSLY